MKHVSPSMVAVTTFLLLFSLQVQIAHAATISVNTIADELNSDGDCSIREAIQAANTNAAVDVCVAGAADPTVDVIDFTVTGTIALASTLPSISEVLTVDGPGPAGLTITGGGAVRVLEVSGGTTLNLEGVTVANGFADSPGGGGILNNGALMVTNSTVSGNSASGGSGSSTATGGGIWSGGTVTLNTSTVSGNSVGGFGGGGGIYIAGGTVTVNDSAVSGNSASSGGGIFNFGTLTLTSSTVSSNTVAASGGGIHNGGGTVTLDSSTISSNMLGSSGGGISFNTGTLTLRNTIVANNQGAQCAVFAGSLTSAGHNMSSDGTCGLTGAGDQPNTDPQLGPLADNGGPTQTHALLPGSPAIDAGSGDCPPPATDQRGVTRPQVAACDIGAVETLFGYPRPQGATPLRVSLVPAYLGCSSPNRTHGPPLAHPSCTPPAKLSQYATVGTPDANGKPAASVGFVRLAVSAGNPSTPADEADVSLSASVTDVRSPGDLTDYGGELLVAVGMRITDKLNGPSLVEPATVADNALSWPLQCMPTADPNIGATCATSTTADALVPGAVPEGKRAIWALKQIHVADGGEDGEAGTTGDNTPFLKQGVFVP
jgi:CSLREA domain-containing protein